MKKLKNIFQSIVLIMIIVAQFATINANSWTKIPECNNLEVVSNCDTMTVVAGKLTSKKTVAIWSEKELTAEQKQQIEKEVSHLNGIGRVDTYQYLYGEGSFSCGITVKNNILSFSKTNDWALVYTGKIDSLKQQPEDNQDILDAPANDPDSDENLSVDVPEEIDIEEPPHILDELPNTQSFNESFLLECSLLMAFLAQLLFIGKLYFKNRNNV